MASPEQEMPFIRNLASSEKRLRVQAITSLRNFLTAQRALDRLTAVKLWKGLFYALWMCDKPVPQQNLAAELATLHDALPRRRINRSKNHSDDDATIKSNVPIWFAAAWEVLAGQWTEIDVLRMDKFMLFARRLFMAHLRWAYPGADADAATTAAKPDDGCSDEERQDEVIRVFLAWPLENEGDTARIPLGMRLHALDVWVDEMERIGLLEKAGTEGEDGTEGGNDALAARFVEKLRREVVEPLTSCPLKSVRKSATDELEDERLPWNKGKAAQDGTGAADEGSEDDEWGGIED